MKAPRIEDFDPNAIPKLGTPMDDFPRIEKAPAPTKVPISKPTPLPELVASKENEKAVPSTSHRDTTTPRNRDTAVSRYHDTFTLVRKAVKKFGKEAATHRFTQTEKHAIAAIIYAFHQREIRTSENEITRIAVNFVIEDFKRNGDGSVLGQVLKLLNQ